MIAIRWIAAAVFSLLAPAALLPFHRPESADLFVDVNQILTEFPEPMELGNHGDAP